MLRAILTNGFTAGPRAPFIGRAKRIEVALRSRMEAAVLGTRLFVSASLRRASVRERAFSDREARCEGASGFLIAAPVSTNRTLGSYPSRVVTDPLSIYLCLYQQMQGRSEFGEAPPPTIKKR